MKNFYCLLTALCIAVCCIAQDSAFLRMQIDTLCASYFEGRGYVNEGAEKAAMYLQGQFKSFNLKSFDSNDFFQFYGYPVNTFPAEMSVSIDGKRLRPGIDFLVDPSDKGMQCKDLPISRIDLQKIRSAQAWDELVSKTGRDTLHAFLLQNIDSVAGALHMNQTALLRMLKPGLYLIPGKGKPIWWTSTWVDSSTVIYLYDSFALGQNASQVSVDINNKLIPRNRFENIIGYVPGTVHPDSFVVVSAHYDHLGEMGANTLFPGASDNASGVAMVLSLAKNYAQHPAANSVAFILFSGEEAGLLGSMYYAQYAPVFPLKNIRFLVNLDILGDATEGVTVVNGTVYKDAFSRLQSLNKLENVSRLPLIEPRDSAADSDHYFFSRNGVPAFYMYSNGGKKYYHDVWDKAGELSLKNVPAVGELLKKFINSF